VNNKKVDSEIRQGSFYKLERDFSDGDEITLKIPITVNINFWPNNEAGIERGPLVFSLPVEKEKSIVMGYERSTKEFPAYEMTPVDSWNYGIVNAINEFTIKYNKIDGYPWDEGNSPITIKVPAEEVKNWEMQKVYDENLNENIERTPPIPANPEFIGKMEFLELVPFGTTTLRVSLFPIIETN